MESFYRAAPQVFFPKMRRRSILRIFGMGIPVLGICYGAQLMAYHLGGAVEFSDHREYGPGTLNVSGASPLFDGLPSKLQVWNSHADQYYPDPARI